jgi:pimeloyl-ACP methyl ester carboxylesterase
MQPNSPIVGHAAGVPFVAVPPTSGPRATAPIVAAWHLLDSPRTEAAFAAALPLAGLDAWRIYLGLPLTGSRLPPGGADEVMQRAFDDVVLKLYGPIVDEAVAEFDAAFAALRQQLGLADGALGVLGGSIGAAVALRVLAESDWPIRCAVLVSPVVQLRRVVEAGERQFGFSYAWSPQANAVANRLDFVARAGGLRRVGQTAVLVVVGEQDDVGFREPAAELVRALGGERTELITVPDMAHALADEPGLDAAPQTPHAAVVDRHARAWFDRYLPG